MDVGNRWSRRTPRKRRRRAPGPRAARGRHAAAQGAARRALSISAQKHGVNRLPSGNVTPTRGERWEAFTHARNRSQRQRAREGPRQGHGPAPGAGGIGRRHRARVVRLLHLRHGRRARVRRPVLQRQGGLRRRHAGGLRHLRRRLRRAPARRDPVRQHGRPHRPPRDADRHDAADGHLDRHHRPAARPTPRSASGRRSCSR